MKKAVVLLFILIDFYKDINFYESNIINDLLGENLESILHKRIHIDNNILTKNFSFFVTNALLFMDVIAYQFYLSNKTETLNIKKTKKEEDMRIPIIN